MGAMRTTWRVLGAVLVAMLVLAWASPVGAQVSPTDSDSTDPVVAVVGDVVVPEGRTVDAVVVVSGDVEVDGRVDNAVFVVSGDIVVRGSVEDAVVTLDGRVTVESGADVGGDVVSSKEADVAEGAAVSGDVTDLDVGAFFGAFWLLLGILFWVALTVSTAVLGFVLLLVIGRRGADRLDSAGRTQVGLSIAWGIGLSFGLPVAGVLLLVTLVGLPLGLALLFALALINGIGYVVGAFFLGRLILKAGSNPYLAFLLGWGILRVAELIPFAGGLLGLAATVYGLGILATALWRLRPRREGQLPAPSPAMATPAAPDPASSVTTPHP